MPSNLLYVFSLEKGNSVSAFLKTHRFPFQPPYVHVPSYGCGLMSLLAKHIHLLIMNLSKLINNVLFFFRSIY